MTNKTHTRSDFREVSRDHPCPVCRHGSWCSVSTDGAVALCRRVYGGMARSRRDKNGDEFSIYRLNGNGSATIQAPRFFPTKDAQRADVTVLDQVYCALLEQLPLEAHHVAALRGRGLQGDLAAAGYRSFPLQGRARLARQLIDRGDEQHFPGVPGFRLQDGDRGKYWGFFGSPGLLIPVRDAEARMVALLIRPDRQDPERKYLSLSSQSKRHAYHGPGPGSPIHVPLFAGDRTTVRITEGALKADVATQLSGTLTVGLPGVNAAQRVPGLLRCLDAKTARIALDADASRNQHVARSLKTLAEVLTRHGFGVELETWTHAPDCKGIDDLFAAGGQPTVLTGEALFAQVEAIVAAAGSASPATPSAPSVTPGARPGHFILKFRVEVG